MKTKHLNTARKMGQNFLLLRRDLDYEEVIAEAYAIACEARETYDSNRARTLNSWIGYIVRRELPKRYKPSPPMLELEEELVQNKVPNNPEGICIFHDSINSLTGATKEAADLVLSGKIKTIAKNPAKREVKKELRQMGYSWQAISIAFNELKIFCGGLV